MQYNSGLFKGDRKMNGKNCRLTVWGVAAALMSIASAAGAAPSALHVSGNQLVNASGASVRLKGVNIPSLEWSIAGQNVMASLSQAMGPWNCKLIRLPICQDRWWGAAPSDYTGPDNAGSYRAAVDAVVNAASSAGNYVLIDMHWSDEGVWGANLGQH